LYLFEFEAFTTFCEVQIDLSDEDLAKKLANDILCNAKRLESQYSYFKEDSQLYKVNHRESKSLHVSDEFAGLLSLALFYSQKTDGAFDVAMAGTLKDNRDNIETVYDFASATCIALESNTLTFSNDITKIDFGGLVKEYAVDQSILILKLAGIKSALVNFGGDIAAIGNHHGEIWNIGIEDPNDENLNIAFIELDACSLCTSGDSKRYKEVDGKKLSHIVSLQQNDYKQISVIAPTTVDAGVWSTALLVNSQLKPPAHIKVVSKIFKDNSLLG
jgi:FAD:protein FMN transferase